MELRMLLVETNGIVQKIEKLFWETQKVGVDLAANGDIALEKAKNNRYDFIAVGVDLEHGFDGFEVILAIKNYTINKNATFIMLASAEDPLYLLKAIELNVNWYIVRPMTISVVKAAIHWITEQEERESYFIVYNLHLLRPFK